MEAGTRRQWHFWPRQQWRLWPSNKGIYLCVCLCAHSHRFFHLFCVPHDIALLLLQCSCCFELLHNTCWFWLLCRRRHYRQCRLSLSRLVNCLVWFVYDNKVRKQTKRVQDKNCECPHFPIKLCVCSLLTDAGGQQLAKGLMKKRYCSASKWCFEWVVYLCTAAIATILDE